LLAESLLVTANGKVDHFKGTFDEWSQAQREAEVREATARVLERVKAAPRFQPVKATAPKRRNPAAPVIDMEQVIVDLEDKLKEIETQLQTATVNQDFEAMTRLGEEHISTQSRLEKSLADWDT
jgi:ATPase subunit of ABC transporter with duplicated ATPase domains